ncbi:MAG TPA: D-alanyl-D-alanine carboxypeptidase/D-alanyl-D-alanine-endopeptidase [Solirubrobacteraceae bacterium]
MAAPRGLATAGAVLVALTCSSLTAANAVARGAPAARSASALRGQLTTDLRKAGGASSALVVDETTDQTLLSIAPTAPRLPASVEKLYTTTAALLELGPSATFTTTVLGVGALEPGGIWKGTLYLRGGGDPTFGDAHFDAVNYGTGATVQQLAAALKLAGIRQVDGPIVGDGSYFDSKRGTAATGYRPSIELEGQLDALAYDAGFQSSAESSLQPQPTLWAAQAFASVLKSSGVRLPRRTRTAIGVTPPGARTLASVSSPPLATILELTNSPSDNFFAETLLKDLGARFGGDGTTADGAAVVRAAIAERLGLHPWFNDGSGLSKADRTTAADVVTLLEHMQPDPTFMNSLAIAGVRGTMQHEMVGTRAVGDCRGKTGTLNNVANLAGYCTAANGDHLVFAFLMNSVTNTDYGHLQEDLMGEALAAYDPTRTTPTRTATTPTRTRTTPTTTVTTPTVGSGGTSPP